MKQCLKIVPSVPVWRDGQDLVFDRKFYDGMLLYVQKWGGRVECLLNVASGKGPDFGVIRCSAEALPFVATTLPPEGLVQRHHLQDCSVVLASADDHRQLHIGDLCRQIGVPCVYVIEYTPETRRQIVAIESANWIKWLKANLFLWRAEKRRIQAMNLAAGVQANGTPAFEKYGHFGQGHLYFDTRINKSGLVSDQVLTDRLGQCMSGRPLRLAFSGRLIGMKGADHLVKVARSLKHRGLAFHMTIYGTGELESALRKEIEAEGLADLVEMPGAVDFAKRLIPEITSGVDLYVMLHRQGDPSCTYLETLSCGIPIVGYNNEAFSGILRLAPIGWAVPMDQVEAVADQIESLMTQRQRLAEASRAAVEFARQHDFEDTFSRRIQHLKRIAQASEL